MKSIFSFLIFIIVIQFNNLHSQSIKKTEQWIVDNYNLYKPAKYKNDDLNFITGSLLQKFNLGNGCGNWVSYQLKDIEQISIETIKDENLCVIHLLLPPSTCNEKYIWRPNLSNFIESDYCKISILLDSSFISTENEKSMKNAFLTLVKHYGGKAIIKD